MFLLQGLSLSKAGFTLIALVLVMQLALLSRLYVAIANSGAPAQKIQALSTMVQTSCIFAVVSAAVIALVYRRRILDRLRNLTNHFAELSERSLAEQPTTVGDDISVLEERLRMLNFELAAAVEKERAIADFAMDIICSLNGNGQIVAISPAAIRLFGYSPDELIGRRLCDLVDLEEKSVTNENIERIKTIPGESTFENRILARDGSAKYISWIAEWSNSEQRLFCVGKDVTVEKDLEMHKRQFVALLSHDLRSPLTAITLDIDQVLECHASALPQEVNLILSRTADQVERLTSLTNCLLDVEQIESGDFKVSLSDYTCADLMEVSLGAVTSLANAKDIELRETYDGLFSIHCDKDRTIQVLVNLLSNAIKFSPPRSRITLSCQKGEQHRVRIAVTDQGHGVPPEDESRLFERFSQLDQPAEVKKHGSGLGLYICKRLISAQGGLIGYSSAEPNGSCFWFELEGWAIDEES